MRLKHIKLVGFKSFVDPTKVPFPHQMTCVVGPNGCGKSNVIDAVRWVLGESSAKNLRGDAMTDVIFNGSTARKPVSQASVELVFDNSEGRIQGEFANYAEISVKRVVTRDAQSSYLLNGSKCRRRDITDLFLGTGLGPRSYAIIEQGMISRLIESKPQELRVFIEEAAGISKYKERRRETESRMQHTRENLDRLHDVRDELGKQLDKLEKQAAAALRYKSLKADERRYKAELQALRWLANDEQVQHARTQQQQHENELEHWISQQRGSESEHDALQEQERELKQQLDQVQQQYYQLGNDVTRTEQQLHHQRQLSAQRAQRLQQVNDDLSKLQEQLAEDEAAQQEHAEQLMLLTPEYDLAVAELAELGEQREAAEDALQEWHDNQQEQLNVQQQWQQELRELRGQAESKSDKLAYLRERLAEVEGEQLRLQESLQQAQLEQDELPIELVAGQVLEQEQRYAAVVESMNTTQTSYDNLLVSIDGVQQQRQSLHGKISSVEHSLASRHQQWQAELQDWLTAQGIDTLGEVSDFVPTGSSWQTALAQVLQPWLSVPVLTAWPAAWPTIQGARFIVLGPANQAAAPAQSVAAELPSPLQHWQFLQTIGLAENPAAAQAMLNHAGGQWQSVICRDGQWLTREHYQQQQISEADSSLRWREELGQLQAAYADVSEQLSQLEQQRDTTKQQLTDLAEQRDTQLQQLQQSQARAIELRERQQYSQQQVRERQAQLSQIAEQLARLTDDAEQLTAEHEELSEQVLHCEGREPVAAQRTETELVAERERLQQQRQQLREQTQHQQQKVSQLETQRQQLLAYQSQGQTLLQRLQQQQRQLEEQRNQLLESAAGDNGNVSAEVQEELQMQLEELLEQRREVEHQRSRLQDQVSELETELKQRNSGQQGILQGIDKARQQLEASKLELSALAERSRNILGVLEEMNQPLKGILTELPENANEREWQATVERLQQNISRLGAINLAAIEEAELQAERKAYLDTQHDDLQSSLDTLESAIRKIDKETRQRFRTTFDAVNGDLQTLFPKVFGGGHAYLELTDDDLLDTGVTIMARPPGKKNSTIHLLSGGEKALTALSLVFAIFRLNPAPFCLLDEVDAPLDDANVARFCRLVEEMSETVQFIYISHNKVAMEMASHLAGVTMQEAGVSRLVAVDVEAAVAMVEA